MVQVKESSPSPIAKLNNVPSPIAQGLRGILRALYADKITLVKTHLEHYGAKQLASTAFITGPGRSKKVQEEK